MALLFIKMSTFIVVYIDTTTNDHNTPGGDSKDNPT